MRMHVTYIDSTPGGMASEQNPIHARMERGFSRKKMNNITATINILSSELMNNNEERLK